MLDACIELDNAIIVGHPGMTFGIHICRGNHKSMFWASRIAEAARFVPLERLAISPQCGFASTHEGNRLSPDDQRRKLELTARTAREIWSDVAS